MQTLQQVENSPVSFPGLTSISPSQVGANTASDPVVEVKKEMVMGYEKGQKTRGFPFTDHDYTLENLYFLLLMGHTIGKKNADGTLETPNIPTKLIKVTKAGKQSFRRIKSIIDYMVFSAEQCPTSGKMHFQGFIYFHSPQDVFRMREILSPRHIEKIYEKSCPKYNRDYCLKGNFVSKEVYGRYHIDSPDYGKGVIIQPFSVDQPFVEIPGANAWEFGRCPEQGERNDIHTMHRLISTKVLTNEHECIEYAPNLMVQYWKTILRWLDIYTPSRNEKPEVIIIIGQAGRGKSYYPLSQGASLQSISGDPKNPFFLDYNRDKVVLFDDWDPEQMSIFFWLKLCDRYPLVVNVKGGSAKFIATTLYFTTNVDFRDWWPKLNDYQVDAVARRMTRVHYILPPKVQKPISMPKFSYMRIDELDENGVPKVDLDAKQIKEIKGEIIEETMKQITLQEYHLYVAMKRASQTSQVL